MTWRIACRIFDCIPPDICPRCGHLIEDPAAVRERDAAQDEIGRYTTTPPEGGAW